MKADLTPVSRAFQTDRDALLYCVSILLLLALPLLLTLCGPFPQRAIYSSLPSGFCDSQYLYKEIYETKSDADVVFVGSSMIWNSIDVPTMQQRLREQCGNDKNVVLLAHNLFGFDADYFLLHDLLQRRRVRLVLIQTPLKSGVSEWPHVLAETWFTFDHWNIIGDPKLTIAAKVALYSQSVLGSPRRILSMLRRDSFGQIMNNCSSRSGSAYHDVGPDFHPVPPELVPDTLFCSSSPRSFDFHPQSVPPYQWYFLNKILSELREHQATLIFIHPPAYDEVRQTQVSEGDSLDRLSGHPDVLGCPGSVLFKGLSEPDIKRLFGDEHHLNTDGSIYFSEAISEGVIRAYQRTTTVK